MTNEEARIIVEQLDNYLSHTCQDYGERDHEAMTIAIKALEQEPCYNPDEWCRTCSEYDQNKHFCPRYNKVIRRAVEEMKQEACEDAISRQATIDTLWTERKKLDSCMQKCLENNQMSLRVLIKAERNRIEEDIYIINNLPPVTPQPKTGHWISYWDEEARCYVYKCPECGNKQPFDTKCCWECGTRLIEPQESEDT